MTRNWKKLLSTMAMAGFLSGAGCLGGAPAKSTTTTTTSTTNADDPSATPTSPTQSNPADPNNTAGSSTDTFNHDSDQTIDPFQVLAREEEEGPPEYSTRMHSCGKVKYATLGNMLADLGVDMTKTGSTTAAGMYTAGAGALGQPIYANRTAESTDLTASGAVKLYDIMVAAAPEIIAAMPTNARCAVAGAATSMFDGSGNCTAAGIACITGAPSTQSELDLCNAAVQANTTDMVGNYSVGQIIAVAALTSAAHSCE